MFKNLSLYLVVLSVLLFAGCLIRGRVVDENGAGIAGVTVTLSGDASMIATTNAEGYYQFGTVDNNLSLGSYIVTPSGSGYNFSPASKNVTIESQALEGYGDVPWPVSKVNFVASCNTSAGNWSGDGMTFTVTCDGKIEDLVYSYEGVSDCYECKFTIENIFLNSSGFSLSNNSIDFDIEGTYIDTRNMEIDINYISSICPLSNKRINVVASSWIFYFDSPGSYPTGLAFDGSYIWNADSTGDKIYKLNTSGNVISSFNSPGSSPTGLAFDGTYLWSADSTRDKIYKLNTSGNVISSFNSPGSSPRGLAFDGTYLWNADSTDDKIYKLNTSGNVISSFKAPAFSPTGLTFDGTYLWSADSTRDKIYKLNTSGNVILSLDSPDKYTQGLAFDGNHLWSAAPYEDKIYKLQQLTAN